MKCKDCNHPLRPRGVKLADAPGTQKQQPGPRCSPCYKKVTKLGKLRTLNCKTCTRSLRPRGVKLAEMPGTITICGDGMCRSCWRLDHGVTKSRKDTRPSHCSDCEERLRPNHSDPAQYPGTVRHVGKGVCAKCKARREAAKRPPKPAPAPQPATVVVVAPAAVIVEDIPNVTDPGLLRLRAERNERKRRQEQAQRIRLRQEAIQRQFIQSRRAA